MIIYPLVFCITPQLIPIKNISWNSFKKINLSLKGYIMGCMMIYNVDLNGAPEKI